MICYAFPLAHEAAPLLALCTQKESFSIGGLKCTLANFHDRPVLIALIGMGRRLARANTETLLSYFPPAWIYSQRLWWRVDAQLEGGAGSDREPIILPMKWCLSCGCFRALILRPSAPPMR